MTLLAGALLVSIPWLAFYGVPSLLANLFDLDMKFCDVESLDYVLEQVSQRFGRT